MNRNYTDDDVARWEVADRNSIDVHSKQLSTALPAHKVDFHSGMLSIAYYMHGMTLIAQRAFAQAIQAFRASAEVICKMYERFSAGNGRELEAGHFQSVLVVYVTKDQSLISRLVSLYLAEAGTRGSIYLGRAVKLLAMGDIDNAINALAERKPRFESQFVGYAECLEAIATKDAQRFVEALNMASKNWSKWASRTVKGLPDSVCFIQGAGLVLLAEHVLGTRIPINNEAIPQQLL